ncbi:hypothetical protein [Cytophaga aurantiaca]|uniref:hypothetical protein n=1 Tax=Cytophaga aurantiaca TaxID=29530 RepID=UPI00036AA98F|nr:hypothetical protein [Cytophaga aurantiaca]
MKKTQLLLLISISFALLTGCEAITGKEIGRLTINKISKDTNNLIIKDTSLVLKKDEKIAFWSDMDMEYKGNVSLRFKIEILKNNENVGVLTIDPTDKNITIGEVKTSLMNKTSWSFTGKNSEFTIPEDATYTFKGILIASDNPTLKIKKAEIILKK